MKEKLNPMPLDEFLVVCQEAKNNFFFLNDFGMKLVREELPASNCFKDGFRLVYSGTPVSVDVEYYDCEFMIFFKRGEEKIPYLFIDHYLFSNQSGYAGVMFAREKVKGVILKTSADVQNNYTSILRGDDDVWRKITALYHAPVAKKGLP